MNYEIQFKGKSEFPTLIENEKVKLMRMQKKHAQGLYEAGQFAEIWQYTTAPYCLTESSTDDFIRWGIQQCRKKQLWPFVIIDKTSGKVVGSSSYLNIALAHKAIEIGYTFLTPSAQKTAINRNCKFLLLSYAFEHLHVNRVAFQTHEKNTKSRTAIEGLGASFEGIHRNCRIQHNGDIRSSAFYSIIKPEWHNVKTKLIEKINIRR